MSNLRWCQVNHALTGTVGNGSGGGAPPRSETSPGTHEKFLQKSRLNPWIWGTTPPSPNPHDTILSSAKAIQVVGVHGFDVVPGTVVVSCKIYALTSGTYPTGTFTLQATIPVGATAPRDFGTVLAAPVTSQYWRHEFVFTGGGTVGKASAGKAVLGPLVDLGKGPSAGGDYAKDPLRYRVEGAPTLSKSPIIHDLGRDYREYVIPLNKLSDAEMAKVEALKTVTDTITLIDSEDLFYEAVIVGSGRIGQKRPFNTYWGSGLQLVTLG